MRSIQIRNEYRGLVYPPRSVHKLFRTLESWGDYSVGPGELSIVFLSDCSIAALHADFMDDPTPTDVITFQGDPLMDFGGEICVSVDHARSQAAALQVPFVQELTLYLIHGWLHLAGLNDTTDVERAQMRLGEQRLLKYVEAKAVIPVFRFI